MARNYAHILENYDLPAMLWRLNDACGKGNTLELAELQEIRGLVESLRREQNKPVKQAFVCQVTLFHDGKTVSILRRGKGASVSRQYKAGRRFYRLLLDLCYKHGEVYGPYALHVDRTVYRICEYVPQG